MRRGTAAITPSEYRRLEGLYPVSHQTRSPARGAKETPLVVSKHGGTATGQMVKPGAGVRSPVKCRARTAPRRGRMNKTEAAYSVYLEGLRTAGEIIRWDFEAERLRLADGAYYCPDFRIILPDGTIEFVEVKGFMREAAHLRIKVAAELHPYTFRLVRRMRGGWDEVLY